LRKIPCYIQEFLYTTAVHKVMLAWLGITDLRAASGELGSSVGPIGQAARIRSFTHIVLLSDHDRKIAASYVNWFRTLTEARIEIDHVRLSSPTHFGEIYEAATAAISKVHKQLGADAVRFTYHLSPGTPAMAAIWILLAKTSYPGEMIESSPQEGVKTVSLPFEIAADYLPDIAQQRDDDISRFTQGLPPETPEFSAIVHHDKTMKRLLARARRIALHDIPVLIQGESGTGKELLAQAIHKASTRRDRPFIAVNCGAIPSELVEAEFFGHTKGAFTGAEQARTGYLEEADGGTLFLDEVGELPLKAQVKLLRALQEGTVQKIGSNSPRKVNIRFIAATNRILPDDVKEHRFREDLFHRLAVGVLNIPPLRDRKGDLNLLIDQVLRQINREFADQTGWKHKKLSTGGKNLMQRHPWPGNVRELYNCLSRAAIWSAGDVIQTEDIQESLFPVSTKHAGEGEILNLQLGADLRLPDLLAKVARHYLSRALIEAKGNKTRAAELIGLSNYQTFSNWMTKYGIEL
jgi:DNA-binding NtrC family response regulator